MVYDNLYKLTGDLKSTQEYKDYIAAKSAIDEDERVKSLIDEYNKLYIQATSYYVSGIEPDEELSKSIMSLNQLLSMNEDATNYIDSERRFQEVVNKVIATILKEIDMKPSFME